MNPIFADIGTSVFEVMSRLARERQAVNLGQGFPDDPGPADVRAKAAEAIVSGWNQYPPMMGLPELREAIAQYTGSLHPAIDARRVVVTSGGVNALMLAVQALVDAGDEVVVVTPVWPNLVAQPAIMGAQVRCVALRPVDGAWTLDLPALLAAVTASTKLLVVNAPNNPTGWTLTRDEQQRILAHCRETGTWLLADEVYERLYFDATPNRCAPSFLDVAAPDDRLVVAHSFSKSFLMTGWRLGWLVVPDAMVDAMAKLIEFNTSCASVFTQRAALAALAHREEITPAIVAHLQRCRDTLVPLLAAIDGVQVATPRGGMYAFFRIEGFDDSMDVARRLVVEAGLGLAPGAAFAPEASGWLRWCFASKDPARLVEGVRRLREWLEANRP